MSGIRPEQPSQDPIRGQDDLLRFFRRGHRPRTEWRLGLEYEQFVTDRDGRPVPYGGPQGVEALLQRAAALRGWEPQLDRGRVIGLRAPDGRAITLEPGAQIEFASTPCAMVDQVAAEVADYLELLRSLAEETGHCFVALGAQPAAAPDQIERLPKARYDILEPYLAATDELGLWMMKATAGLQVNLDHEDAEDAARKLRLALGLAPLFNAMFANSPVRAGSWSGYASWRGHVWTRTDPSRCGMPADCMRHDSSLEDYVHWALQAPMLFIERQGQLLDMRGRTFAEYLSHGRDALRATEDDWDLHLSTLFPEARFRPQLELRAFDTQCPRMTLAICALVEGLFYDRSALQAAWELVGGWSESERQELWRAAHRAGLAAEAPGGVRLLDLARELVAIGAAASGAPGYLEHLSAQLAKGASIGERLGERFRGAWGGDLSRLVHAARCLDDATRPAGQTLPRSGP